MCWHTVILKPVVQTVSYFPKNEKVMFLLDSDPDLSFMTVTVGPIEDHCFHITIWQRLRAVIKCRLNKFHQHEDLK